MKFIKRYLPLIFFGFSLRSQTVGQIFEQSLDLKLPFTVTRYSSKQGVPQSQVLSIVSYQSGALVLSTSNGIAEFNGVTFKPLISDAYRATTIKRLLLHEGTKRIFGTEPSGTLHLLYPGTRLLKNVKATCMEQDSLFCIDWAGSIYAAPVKQPAFKKTAETHLNKHIMCLMREKSGFLIGTLTGGVYRYDSRTGTTTLLLREEVVDLKINPFSGSTYVMCAQAVYELKGGEFINVLSLKQFKHAICTALDFKSAEELFVASTHGLYYINGSNTTLYDKSNALPSQYLQSLYYNHTENCLLVGTAENGLLRLQFKNCYSFASKQGFVENPSLVSIIKTRAGDLLTALIDGNIYKIEEDTVYPYCEVKNELYSSLAEIGDTIYAGTWGGGVKLIANKRYAGTITAPALTSGYVHAMFRDSKKNTWIGNVGVSKGTSAQNMASYLAGQIKADVNVFYELKNGSLCAGSNNGIFILDANGRLIKHLSKAEGLQGKEVRSFYEDSEGKLWIGTYGGGLYCYHKERLTHINQLRNAMLNEDAFCMARDSFGYFYITSNHGLWRVKEKDLDDFYKGRLDYLIPFYYCMENGILNEEFNGGFQNNYLAANGRFYFPSIEGFVRVTPEQPQPRKLYPKLSRMLVNDTLSGFENKSFGRKTHSIQFDFESINLVSKYNVYYQYKLLQDGNEEWSPLQKNASVSFKMLPPNTYTFCLRALDAFNDRQPAEVTFVFAIQPYFYETFGFRIGAVLLFLILTLLIGIIWMRRYKNKAEEKERIKRELAELELKAVQSQMNPHFIFNSLNSIKHYLHTNDTKNADIFIDNFSLLLRDFMEYSNKNFTTLKKETDMLSSYLALENMRMNPPFQYTISMPPELGKTKVPTLLFQAFVENAIKHGITHSLKPCAISITFSLEDSVIFCVITDTGIGRKRSEEINRNRPYHTSKGISLVNEKIKVMKETHALLIEVLIEDLVDEDGQAAGTKVTIKIPVKND